VIELAYNAHPPAIHEEGLGGWLLPLHWAHQGQAAFELVQFLVERSPAALETADDYRCLPLHLACHTEASLEDATVFGGKEPRRSRSGRQAWIFALALGMLEQGIVRGGAFFGGTANPATVGMANMDGDLPFGIACEVKASLELLRVLVERTPATVNMTDYTLHATFRHQWR
jgi:hypothetical protein